MPFANGMVGLTLLDPPYKAYEFRWVVHDFTSVFHPCFIRG